MFKGRALEDSQITDAMFAEVVKMLNDPDEAWWVSLYAIEALARADKDLIAENRDRLLQFVNHKSIYHQEAAVTTLAKICADPKHYQAVLPELIRRAAEFRVDRSSSQSARAIQLALQDASRKVKDFASPILMEIYSDIPSVLTEPNTGAVMMRGANTVRGRIGAILQTVPGGEEFIRTLPKTTLESHISGDPDDMFTYGGKFEKNKELVGTWEWAVWPAASKPSEIDDRIKAYAKKFDGTVTGSKDTLQLFDDGQVKSSNYYRGYFWSGDRLIGVNENQALKMEVRKEGGYDWLIVERGGFEKAPETEEDATAEVPKDYHCGFHIYARKKDNSKKQR